MNTPATPLLDTRTPGDVATEVRQRLGWPHDEHDTLREALIAVFGRYAELLGRELNAAPERHLDAFLDLLRPARFAATPASTLLAFRAVARPAADPAQRLPTLPAGTQVAGAAPPGQREPLVFETLAPLTLSPARVLRAIAVDAGARRWVDATPLTDAGASRGFAFERALLAERAMYLGVPEEALAASPTSLRLHLELEGAQPWHADVIAEWSLCTAAGALPVVAEADGTNAMTQSGDVVFGNLPAWPATMLEGHSAHWLRCRITVPSATPLMRWPARPARTVWLRDASIVTQVERPPSPVAGAFHDMAPLDPSRDFYPLGEWPRFGDVFVVQSDAFALPGAQVRLDVKLTNAADSDAATPIPRVSTDHSPLLQWDVRTASGWAPLAAIKDETEGFTRSGSVMFELPKDAATTTLNGAKGAFVRARLARGDYIVEPRPGGAAGAALTPPVHRPPSIARLTVAATLQAPHIAPSCVVVERDLERTAFDASTTAGIPVLPSAKSEPASLYLGLQCGAPTPGTPERLHFVLQAMPPIYSGPVASAAERMLPLRWQYRTAQGWADARTELLPTPQSDMQEVIVEPGDDWRAWTGSTIDASLRWLRISGGDEAEAPPPIARVLLNAVTAMQRFTAEGEVLGSSSGAPAQQFTLAHRPVLDEPLLEICEPGVMAEADRQALIEDGGADAVRIEPAAGRLPARTWVLWRRVEDFSASGPQSRHYVLDAHEGSVHFGDGRHGCIPPAGPNNIVMRRYRSGGGAHGNAPAGSLKQLRTTTPYVEAVLQPEASTGGQDAETPAAARMAASAWLRHRDRAIGPDDYEDLACRATAEVARARCVAACDLGADPLGRQSAAGCVSVAILPRDESDPAPRPSPSLLARVRSFLVERSAPGVRLLLCSPVFVRIHVDVEVLAAQGAAGDGLALACEARIARFLHPVVGGPDDQGWPFGRRPHASELRTALRDVPGLVEIRQLRLRAEEELPGGRDAVHALVCAGRTSVSMVV